MLLSDAKVGEKLLIIGIDDEKARITALRFGIAEGAKVCCLARIPRGPIVICSGRQEIALGRNLAKLITVERLPEAACTDHRPTGPMTKIS